MGTSTRTRERRDAPRDRPTPRERARSLLKIAVIRASTGCDDAARNIAGLHARSVEDGGRSRGRVAHVTLLEVPLLFVAAFLGGALNSVAGGGSFISFPALLFVGVPAVAANATSSVAL